MLESAKKRPGEDPRSSNLSVVDIGCGNGTQTIELAKHVDGTIMAVEIISPF